MEGRVLCQQACSWDQNLWSSFTASLPSAGLLRWEKPTWLKDTGLSGPMAGSRVWVRGWTINCGEKACLAPQIEEISRKVIGYYRCPWLELPSIFQMEKSLLLSRKWVFEGALPQGHTASFLMDHFIWGLAGGQEGPSGQPAADSPVRA